MLRRLSLTLTSTVGSRKLTCGNQRTGDPEGFLHIRKMSQFRRDLEIADSVVLIDHHDRPGKQVWAAQEQPVGLAELAASIVGQKRDIVDLSFLREPLLRERRIDAHSDEFDQLVEPLILFAEMM